jgi:hypothetical protein
MYLNDFAQCAPANKQNLCKVQAVVSKKLFTKTLKPVLSLPYPEITSGPNLCFTSLISKRNFNNHELFYFCIQMIN